MHHKPTIRCNVWECVPVTVSLWLSSCQSAFFCSASRIFESSAKCHLAGKEVKSVGDSTPGSRASNKASNSKSGSFRGWYWCCPVAFSLSPSLPPWRWLLSFSPIHALCCQFQIIISTPKRSSQSFIHILSSNTNLRSLTMPAAAKDESKSTPASGDLVTNGKGAKNASANLAPTDGPSNTVAELDTKLSTGFTKKMRNLEKRKVCYEDDRRQLSLFLFYLLGWQSLSCCISTNSLLYL